MTEQLFDRSAEYDHMLHQGLRLSGEDKSYFLRGRVQDLKTNLSAASEAKRILDFGCGIGDSTAYLAETFPNADVVGSDTAAGALEHARRSCASPRVRFISLDELSTELPFDLCYVNGVFHHINLSERGAAVAMIHRAMRPGAHLALFENNPWNPGTRMVMSRIPFDRDAVPLSCLEALALLRRDALFEPIATRFLFYFPRVLAALRFSEPLLARVPLGAQYYVLARRPLQEVRG